MLSSCLKYGRNAESKNPLDGKTKNAWCFYETVRFLVVKIDIYIRTRSKRFTKYDW